MLLLLLLLLADAAESRRLAVSTMLVFPVLYFRRGVVESITWLPAPSPLICVHRSSIIEDYLDYAGPGSRLHARS